ncbi:MAG: dienelactone hydrolase family protein [Elusimicrobiota bacterium]
MAATTSSLHRETIRYKAGTTDLEGMLVYDGSTKGRRPGVLLAHSRMGLDAFTRRRAVQLARRGGAVFALDLYGEGRGAQNAAEADELARALFDDRALLRARAQAALKILREQRFVESRNLAAVGFGLGGCAALELARGGADLRGAVSFHGTLKTGGAGTEPGFHGRLLVLHGAEDALVPPPEVAAFQQEMKEAKADWRLITYGGCAHAFTDPDAGTYNGAADTRSWAAACAFLDEIFD